MQSNDQRLLERILEDQHRKLAPDKSRDDFFTFFAADKALQDWDLDNDEITDGIVDTLALGSCSGRPPASDRDAYKQRNTVARPGHPRRLRGWRCRLDAPTGAFAAE
ncbi:hypothetical protein [Streptomyces sp. NPDC003697]